MEEGAWRLHIPVNKNSSTAIKAFLNEGIAGGEMLNHVLILNIVHLNDQMPVGCEEVLIQGETQCRDDMANSSILQSLIPP